MIQNLVYKLRASGHSTSELELKRALLQDLRREISITAKVKRSTKIDHYFAVSNSIIFKNIMGERALLQNQASETRSKNNRKSNIHQYKECYYSKKKERLSAKCYFNPKSKNFKRKKQHTSNGKKPNLFSEEDTAIIVQTCAFVSNGGLPSSEKWMLDSPWTRHICYQRQCLKRFTEKRSEIIVGNMETVTADGFGNLSIQSTVNGTGYMIELRNVMYASNMTNNLILCSKARRCRMKIDIDESDHDLSKGMMWLVKKRNDLIKMNEMENKEGI